MYIKELYIESFAGMKDREFSFSKGLNVIEGSNESGKSTLCMFIKFIFYGLSGRGNDGEMSERQKYVPWDTGRAAGSLTVVTAKGEYKITRDLSVSDGETPRERLSVIDLSSGNAVFKGKVPGECILGMDDKMFVNTVFVRQIGGTAIDGTGMTEAIENILLSGDENVNMKKALDRLDKARKSLMHKRGTGGALQLALQDRARIEREIAESKQGNTEMIELEGESEKLASLISLRTKERDKNEALCDAYLKICAGKRAEEGLSLKRKTEELKSCLSELDRYGNVSEKMGKINAGYARFTAVEAKLSVLRDSMGDEPDRSCKMTDDDILSARADIANAKKYDKKRKQFALSGIIICVLGALIASAGSYLNIFTELAFGAAVFYGGIGVLAFGCVFPFLCLANASKLKAIRKKWGVSLSAKGLEEEILSRIEKALEYDRVKKERDEKFSDMILQEDERRKILALLRTAALEFSEEDFEDVGTLVEKALESAAQISEKREKLSGEAGIANGELKAFADVLSDDNGKATIEVAKKALDTEEGKAAKDFTRKDFESCKNKKHFAENVLPGLLKRKGEVDALLAKLKATTKDTAILSAQLDCVKRDIEGMQRRLSGIEEAIKALQTAGEGLRASLVPFAISKAGELMEGFTGGKYEELLVENDFSVNFKINGVKRDIYYMSAGTADSAYISLRAALAGVLFREDSLPLIYDESFARIDEKRLAEILAMLEGIDGQSLVFTCRTLEAGISGGEKILL